MIKLGVHVHIRKGNTTRKIPKKWTPSAHCSQCDKVVKRCPHVTPWYDGFRYALCDCATHKHHHTLEWCAMVEYLDGKHPGRMVFDGGTKTKWTWPDGQPTVRCLNCGTEWLEPAIGHFIGKAKDAA